MGGGARTVRRLERLEKLNQLDRAQQVRVLGRDLHYHREVLAEVGLQHLVQAAERLLDGKLAKVVDEPLCAVHVGVHNAALDVGIVFVVLECLLMSANP